MQQSTVPSSAGRIAPTSSLEGADAAPRSPHNEPGAPAGEAAGVAAGAAAAAIQPPFPLAPPRALGHPSIPLRVLRRIEQATAVFAFIVQVTLWSRQAAVLSPTQHLRQAALTAAHAAVFTFATIISQQAWLKFRVPLIFAIRVSIASVPSHRSAHEGLGLLLDRPANPGLLGALQDWMRLLTGTRILFIALVGSLLHQPPLVVLLQQVVLMGLTASNPAYCSTQLLAHELMQQRQLAICQLLEMLAVILPPQMHALAGATGLPASLAQQARCMSLLTVQQVLIGIVLPTVIAAWTTQSLQPDQQQQQQPQQQQQYPAAANLQRSMLQDFIAWMQSAVAAAGRTWVRLDSGLRNVCCGAGIGGQEMALLCWMMTGGLWLVSKVVATTSLVT